MPDSDTIEGLIQRSGRSLAQIASDCDVSKATVWNWKANNAVTPGNYEAFADAVRVDVDEVKRISGAGSNKGAPGSDAEMNAWLNAAFHYSDDPYLNATIQSLMTFRDPETGIVTVTIEEIDQRTPLKSDMVRDRWPDVLASPLVERISSEAVEARGVWVLRLVQPA